MDDGPGDRVRDRTMVDPSELEDQTYPTPRLSLPFLPPSPSPSPLLKASGSPKPPHATISIPRDLANSAHPLQQSQTQSHSTSHTPSDSSLVQPLLPYIPPSQFNSPPTLLAPSSPPDIPNPSNLDPDSNQTLPQTLTPPSAFPEKFRYVVCTSSWLGGRPSGGSGSGMGSGMGEGNGVGVGSRSGFGGDDGMIGSDMDGSDGHVEHPERKPSDRGSDEMGHTKQRGWGDTLINGNSEHVYESDLGAIARRAGMRLRVRYPSELGLGRYQRHGDVQQRENGLDGTNYSGQSRVGMHADASNAQEVIIPNAVNGQGDDAISLFSAHSSSSTTSCPSSITSSSTHSQSTITLPLLNIASLSLTIHFLRSRPDISLAFLLGLTGLTWVWKLVGTIWWQVVAGVAVLIAAGLKLGMEMARRRGWVDESVMRRVEREREKKERRERRERRKTERIKRAGEMNETRCLPDIARQSQGAEAVAPDEANPPRGQDLEHTGFNGDVAPTPNDSLQSLALEALKTVIQESDGFDEVIGRALALLGRSESDSPTDHESEQVAHRPLRQRLDQVLTTVVAQITTSTQILIPLISQEELATFSEMYSIEDGASRRTSSTASRSVSMGMSDGSKRLSGMSIGVFSDCSEDGQNVNGQDAIDLRNGGQGLATAKGKRRTRTEDGPPPHQDYAVPFSPLPRLRSSQSTPFLRLGSPISQHDRFTSFPMRSPRPASRQSWTASVDRSFSSSEEDTGINGSATSGSQRACEHTRTESEALTPMRAYRYGTQPKSVQEDCEEDRPVPDLPSYKLPRPARPVSMHGHYSTNELVSIPFPRPRSSQEMRSASGGSSDLDPAFVAPVTRPSHGLRQLRLSQSSITGITGLPLAPPLPSSPNDRSPVFSDFGMSASPARPIPDLDRQRKRSSWQESGSRRPLSFHASSPNTRRQVRAFADQTTGDAQTITLSRHGFGSGASDSTLQRSNSIPFRRSDHSRNASASQASGSYPPSTYPLSQQPFPTFAGGQAIASNQFLQTPARPRANRTVSLGPLTLSSLKASFLNMHLKRRKAACCLLALRFDITDVRFTRDAGPGVSAPGEDLDPVELARYWAAVHAALDELHRCLSESTAIVGSDLAEIAGHELDLPRRHQTRFSGARSSGESISHAPKHSDSELLVDRADSMASALRKLQMQLGYFDAETTDPGELAMKWDVIREDLGGIIRDWEKGRSLIKRMVSDQDGQHADVGLFPEDMTLGHEAIGRGLATGRFARVVYDVKRTDIRQEVTQFALEEEAPADDATSYLIQETSPTFLPPPGIESVFEGLSTRGMRQEVEGPRMSREERIKAIKAARAIGTAGSAEASVPDPLNSTDGDVRTRSGEMVHELKGVIGELQRRREARG